MILLVVSRASVRRIRQTFVDLCVVTNKVYKEHVKNNKIAFNMSNVVLAQRHTQAGEAVGSPHARQ